MRAAPPLVAIVDDDAALRESLVALFASAGYAAVAYACAEDFLQSRCRPACLMLDQRLPGMSGFELLRWLRAHGDVVPAVMMSARDYDDLMRVQATSEGVACLRKPFTWDELSDAVRGALDRHEPKVQ